MPCEGSRETQGDIEKQGLDSFDSLYATLFGSGPSGDRPNFSANPATRPSANESLYPSSPYQQHQMPTSPQMHSGGLGQTPNGLSYPTHSTDEWHPSGPPAAPPQHLKEPYSIGPFDSIWSMKSSEMAGASAGVQNHQKKAGDWSSETTATASGYHDTPHTPKSTTNGLPFGTYDQQVYGHDDVGFHGDVSSVTTPGGAWSPCDGVNDANVSGLPDWNWNQGEYSSVQAENWQPTSGPEMVGNMANPAVNEWELQEDELARKNEEEDMKGRQERREWAKKGLNYTEFVPAGSAHKQKSHANSQKAASLNGKVVATFLQKYRDKDPEPLTPESSIDSNLHIQVGTGREFPSQMIEELGPVCGESVSSHHIGNIAVNVPATDRECHVPAKTVLQEPGRCDSTGDYQETASNVDSSDLRDRMGGREVRSLSDPVTVQEAQQSNGVKIGTTTRKTLSNGKIRPGKRKPKLPRDKRRSMAPADKSETESCGKQTVQVKTKEQPEGIDKNVHLVTNRTGLMPKLSSKSLNSTSSEHIVQSSKPTKSSQSKSCIPDNAGANSLLASKAHAVNSKTSCQQVPPMDQVSVNHASCLESSICDECDSKSTLSEKVFQSAPVKENLGIKDDMSLGVSYCGKPKEVSEKPCVSSKNVQEQSAQAAPLDKRIASQNDSSDCSRHVTDHVIDTSQNNRKEDFIKGMRSTPVQNQTPSCESDGNSSIEKLKLTDELKLGNSNKVPTTTGSSKHTSPKSTSTLIQGQEKTSTRDNNLFFDPKRIFGGQKPVKTAEQKQKKEAEKSTNSLSAARILKNSRSNVSLDYHVKGKDPAQAAESEQCSELPDCPTVQQPANLTKSVRSSKNEGMANGTVPSKDLPLHPAQTVPSSSAKDALASKTSAMKAEPTSSQHHREPIKQPASPTDPRPSRMYSYKKDDDTGVLRRSSDPKVEEATTHQSQRRDSSGTPQRQDSSGTPQRRDSSGTTQRRDSSGTTQRRDSSGTTQRRDSSGTTQRRDSSGTQSSSDEGRGERRCSGESHMDGFHHPFGCSAHCYRKSSTPSSSRSSSNSRSAPSGVNQSTGSASSEEKTFSQTKQPNVSDQCGNNPSEKVFDASAFAELREGLKNSWLSKEKEKQREEQKKQQERAQAEHLEKEQQRKMHEQRRQQELQEQRRQQEKLAQRVQQEKQEQKKQQGKPQSSASHAKRPTRATYSKPKSAEQESKAKRPGPAKDRPMPGTSAQQPRRPGTQQPRRPWPSQPEDRPRTPSQEDSAEDSDLEEDLARGITDEWWFHLGKKLCNGVAWLILFTILLCLVILSFVLAFARDTCKFAYRRGWELWAWYREKSPRDDDDGFFSSHRSHQRESGDGGWGSSGQQGQGARTKKPRKKQTQNIDLPSTEHAAIHRILACDPGSYYEVVGVAEDAPEDDIKKFYRKQCMLVHPDKTDQPQANEAFQILQKAYAILSDTTKRTEYDFELDYKEDLQDKVNDLFKKMAEAADAMPCGVCRRSHKRYETDLPISAARFCATHNTRHPVSNGALWKETRHLGFKIFVYLCDERTVYDVTEWAACQNLDWLEANSCRLLCKVKRGGRGSQQQRQQHSAGYEEMFDNIFGSGAFHQFQSSANEQSHHRNSHHGNGGGGGGGHGHGQQGGGSRNKGVKKSRKKKK
ncbi:titin homolog isoform X2 [Strongylocentrotus purpuratus]|uniref:J domain-containing protein n=1 Tax=Strongylocentrotus purpuratus TaxID=7668 RepID=A0A7M7PK65_STRPU|nr:titin homolog isoform X2 [Strongylocentrotus purpuratus]